MSECQLKALEAVQHDLANRRNGLISMHQGTDSNVFVSDRHGSLAILFVGKSSLFLQPAIAMSPPGDYTGSIKGLAAPAVYILESARPALAKTDRGKQLPSFSNTGISDMATNGFGAAIQYNPATVSMDATLEDVLQHANGGGARDFPVVDKQNRLLGLLTKEVVEKAARDAQPRPWSVQVIDVMISDMLTLDHNTTPADALHSLRDRSVSSAPVVENGRLVGMVTTSDLTPFAV